MIVKFKNPHPGVGGPIEVIPEKVSAVIRILDGMSKTLDFALGALACVAPEGYWLSLSMKDGCLRLLHCDADYPDEGFSIWRLIEFEEVKS